MFQENNARPHTANVTLNTLREDPAPRHESRPQPHRARVGSCVRGLPHQPENIAELVPAVLAAWDEVQMDTVNRLICEAAIFTALIFFPLFIVFLFVFFPWL